MGVLSICHVCSHLQNATRARFGITSIPASKFNLSFALALHRAGFLSSVERGGLVPPGVEFATTAADVGVSGSASSPSPFSETGRTEAQLLAADGVVSMAQAASGGVVAAAAARTVVETTNAPLTAANVATRRLWLGLKYWDNAPVLSRLRPVSTPSRRVMVGAKELERVVRGLESVPPPKTVTDRVKGMHNHRTRRAGATQRIKGLGLGECLFLSTDRGVLEAREAVEKSVGGVVLARVS